MRIALLADVHANWGALQAVWSAIQDQPVDHVWFLGDITDRGPNPVECVLWLRDEIHNNPANEWVMGNHDAMLVDLLTAEQRHRVNEMHLRDNAYHRKALEQNSEAWTFITQEFTPKRLQPHIQQINDALLVMVHGGLVDNAGYYRYLYPWWSTPLFAQSEFDQLNEMQGPSSRLLFCGHSHVQMLIKGQKVHGDALKIEPIRLEPGRKYALSADELWLINPGSTGQPRNLDNRAQYAILDVNNGDYAITFHRQEYDWRSTALNLLPEPGTDLSRQKALERYRSILRDANPDRDTPDEWLSYYAENRGMP